LKKSKQKSVSERNTLLHVVHCSSYGPDDGQG